MRRIWEMIKLTLEEWSEDKVPRLGAALSFFAVFAIAPLLVLAIAVAGFVYGDDAVSGKLFGAIKDFVGENAASAIQSLLAGARVSGSGVAATLISVITLFIAASGLFAELQDSLDTIWEVAPRPDRGWRDTLRERSFAFLMVIGAGVLLLAFMLANAVLPHVADILGELPGGNWMWAGINFVLPIVFLSITFAIIFKYLPDVQISWRDVWVGAIFTAVLITLGKYLIGLYLGRSSVTNAYGAAGSLAVLLLWIYYSSQIFFLGAEFTQVYARRFGHGVRPRPNAIPVTEEARAEQGIPHKEQLYPRPV
jgi:membrane protein